MKLLLETWRQYIKEGEAAHFPWLKDLPEEPFDLVLADRLRDRLQDGDDRFKILGAGAFRTVWVPRGDDEHVIKVVHDLDDYKLQMNKDDFETAKRYPLIFPKAYAHANDFEWIVMENTPPLIDMEEMQKVLDQSFSAEQKAILGNKVSDDPSDADRKALELQKIIAPVAGPAYQELSKAMHEFEIDKYEIGIGNIGHDENYNFKIIDSSVFSSDPEDGGW